MSTARLNVCVIGAGNGGTAMAGHLGLNGHEVRLYSRTRHKVATFQRVGGVRLTGAVQGFGPIALATHVLKDAVQRADVIMVTTPANAHRAVARSLAPLVEPHQLIVLNPGRTGGALEVRRILQQWNKTNPVAEAQTFIYASRSSPLRPEEAHIFEMKREVPVAAMPGRWTQRVLFQLRRLYPQFVPARNVLETSFANIGAIFHPAPILLNASKVESGECFDHYHQGISPSIATLMEEVDAERLAVAEALGVRVPSAKEWLKTAYGAEGETLHEAIHNNDGYDGIKAPTSLQHRYITEDVPTGLLPIASFGRHVGVPTPYTESLIQMACGISGVNYWETGRTVQSLGLQRMDVHQIQHFVATGLPLQPEEPQPFNYPVATI